MTIARPTVTPVFERAPRLAGATPTRHRLRVTGRARPALGLSLRLRREVAGRPDRVVGAAVQIGRDGHFIVTRRRLGVGTYALDARLRGALAARRRFDVRRQGSRLVVRPLSSNRRPPPTTQPAPTQPAPADDVLFADDFTGSDGLITNHYSRWSGDPTATQSPDWEMDSGSLRRESGAGWTGVPTSDTPNKDSSNGSGSNLFRLFTKRDDFSDVSVTFDLRNNGYTSGSAERPAVSWDGVKIFLRRQSGTSFYTAEVNRRQGNLIIQKKCDGLLPEGESQAAGGTYFLLAQTSAVWPARQNRWEKVGGTVETNADGSVTVKLIRDADVALSVTDRGRGCAPLTAAGSTGVRGDNTNFNIDGFRVRPRG